jgi:serine/threonine protein kinase/tetratricopeptide (TPR) repeat protein
MNERDLFMAALQLDDDDERAAYLDRACAGEAALRQRVEALLAAFAQAGGFLQQPAVDLQATSEVSPPEPPGGSDPPERPGTVIGPYQLLEQIGEGGMGTVWMAQQTEPVKRLVAIKLIKAGMDSRQVIVRFEAERQALALMDHGNIARVLDVGTSGAGRPYFVMDLVKGVPITRYCDEHHLTPRQRLELFIPVCQAVQHAHQKGIIHRDLKPSNVLVALYDGQPVPKVIDFGVAKAAGPTLTEKTLFTGFGALVGTLEYMSPEQAELNNLDIDTRSDVYALGVLLYELLAGSPPFTREESERGGVLEMLHVIREQEPPRPSTKLSTAEGLPALAASRGTEPAKLARLVRGELDWIVMKALEKDRNRRYKTANGFALDVQRHLADEPVLACPPSAGYRFRKFARRNKASLSVGSLLAVMLGLGTAISTWQAIRATQAEGLAEERLQQKTAALQEVTRENDEKRQALAIAFQEKQRADRNLAHARKAVKDYLTKAAGNRLLKEADFHKLRHELLASAIPFYLEFVKQQYDDPQLEADRANAYAELARVRQDLGELDQALADHEQRQAIFERLATKFPAKPDYRLEVVECYRDIGNVYLQKDQPARAEEAFRHALKLLQALRDEYPSDPWYRRGQANLWNNLGVLLQALGRLDEALVVHQKAVDLGKDLFAEFPRDPYYRQNLGQCHNNLSNLLFKFLSRQDDALTSIQQAEDLFQKLVNEFPTTPEYREHLAVTLNNKSGMLGELGRGKAAQAAQEQALDIQEKLAADFPSVPSYRLSLAEWHNTLAWSLVRLGRYKESLAACDRAVGILDRLLQAAPGPPEYRQVLGRAHHNRAEVLCQLGSPEDALDAFKKAVSIQKKLVDDYPLILGNRYDLGMSYFNMGEALLRIGRADEAGAAFATGLPLYEKLTHDSPADVSYAVGLAGCYRGMGSVALRQLQPEAALAWYAKALAMLEPVLAKEPRLEKARRFAAVTYAGQALALDELGRHAEALKDWDRALAHDDGKRHEEIKLHRAATLARLNPIPPIALVVGEPGEGTLTRTDPPDLFPLTKQSHHKVFAVPLEAGQPYLIDLRGDFDTFLRIEDAQKKPLGQNDDVRPDDLNSRLVFIPPQQGTYRVVVTSFKPGDTGAFTLSVQKALKVGEPTLIAGKLQDTDRKNQGKFYKVHKLQLTGGSPCTIELESPAFATVVVLLDGTGQQTLAQNDGITPGQTGRSRLDFTPRVDATFFVIVTSFGPGETGAYRLAVQRYAAVKDREK